MSERVILFKAVMIAVASGLLLWLYDYTSQLLYKLIDAVSYSKTEQPLQMCPFNRL